MLPASRIVPVIALLLAGPAHTDPPATNRLVVLPGQQADGTVMLPNQWSLNPAGRQIALGDFPVNIAVHPGGRSAAVLHCGYGAHEIVMVDLGSERIASRTPVAEAFYGIEFDAEGRTLYCSGAAGEVVRVFTFADGRLEPAGTIALRDANRRGIPGGLALSRDGRTLCAANVWGQDVSIIDVARSNAVRTVALGPDTAKAAPAQTPAGPTPDLDAAAITKRAEAALDPTSPEAPFPYACRIDEQRQRLYVSLWAKACVAVIDLTSGKVTARWPTEEHPNEMVLSRSGRHLFVANANRNSVTVIDTGVFGKSNGLDSGSEGE